MAVSKAELALSRTFDLSQRSAEVTAVPVSGGDLGPPGTIIEGKYELISLLGQGGMGAVYLVLHQLLNKNMALKTIRGHVLSSDSWQQFQREAKAVARLSHTNIVQVYDFGMADDQVPYYTMELLTGQSLAERLAAQGPLPVPAALTLFRSVAAALLHAHNHSIVHRDIKPGNIFLHRDTNGKTVAKVVDFGLAKLASVEQVLGDETFESKKIVFGSPLYMSPEQAICQPTDARTDIYSYGCALFEALTGEPPFFGRSAFATINMHLHEKAPLLSDIRPNMAFSPQLEVLVAKLLAKEPSDRYQSFAEVISQLIAIERNTKNNLPVLSNFQTADSSDSSAVQASTGSSKRDNRFVVPVVLVLIGLIIGSALLITNFMRVGSPTQAIAEPEKPVARYFVGLDRGMRVFHFPNDICLGYISYGQVKPVPARGAVAVPADAYLTFECSDEVLDNPNLLSGFAPDDITSLICRDRGDKVRLLLPYLPKYLKGLSVLQLNNCPLSKENLASIDQLEKLIDLSIEDTSLTGDAVAGMKQLRQLRRLGTGQMENLSILLDRLAGSHNLLELIIENATLSDRDIANIASLVNLKKLTLDHTLVSGDDLKQLSRLGNLSEMKLSQAPAEKNSVMAFKNFKKLLRLRINTSAWTAADRKRLKQLLPQCDIVDQLQTDDMHTYLDQ